MACGLKYLLSKTG